MTFNCKGNGTQIYLIKSDQPSVKTKTFCSIRSFRFYLRPIA